MNTTAVDGARSPRDRHLRGRLNSALGAALVLLLMPGAASANTITVDSNADPSAAGCTLHDAITAANTNAAVNGCAAGGAVGSDAIDLSALSGQTITLAGPLPALASNMDINGPGSGQLSVTGVDTYQPFTVNAGNTASISGLTITHGLCDLACGAQGGAMINFGILTLTDVAVTNSVSADSSSPNAGAEGGGIENKNGATLHVILSVVSGNTVTVSTGTSSNAATAGGIMNRGTLTVDRTTVSGNHAIGTAGAGGSTNVAGGGIDTVGKLTVTQSTLSGNTVDATGSTSNLGRGGGIATFNAAAVSVTLDRSTVAGNTVTVGAPVSTASTGGILSQGPSLTVTSSTISGNSAAQYANLQANATSRTIKNTIVSNPLGGGANCPSFINSGSQGFNIDDGTSCGFTQPGDQQSTDPMLDAGIANNGGPTLTLALLAGSPAIDQGITSGCVATDQRGLARPSDFGSIPNAAGGDGTDVGAFEMQGGSPVLLCLPVTTPLDTSPPETSVSARIRKRKRKASFTFGASEVGSSFMCKLDKRAFAPCSPPVTFKHLRFGKHSFAVEAIDAAGNVDPTPAIFKFKL
jgi:hypothetical protein